MKLTHVLTVGVTPPQKRKSRQPKTHCPHGHEMTPENTVITHDFGIYPRRECRTCRRSRDARKKRNNYWKARGVEPETVLTFEQWSRKRKQIWDEQSVSLVHQLRSISGKEVKQNED